MDWFHHPALSAFDYAIRFRWDTYLAAEVLEDPTAALIEAGSIYGAVLDIAGEATAAAAQDLFDATLAYMEHHGYHPRGNLWLSRVISEEFNYVGPVKAPSVEVVRVAAFRDAASGVEDYFRYLTAVAGSGPGSTRFPWPAGAAMVLASAT